MTEEQKQDLNPLIIKIKGISCLPSQPVPIDELEVRMSQMNWLESSFPSHCPLTCHGLSPSWPSRRWIIIPISPFRISQWDMKEIGFLGLGATKSWGLPWVFFKWEQWSCLWKEPYSSLLQQLILNQPGLALLLVLEAPFPLSWWAPCPWILCLPLALFAPWLCWSSSSCIFLRKGSMMRDTLVLLQPKDSCLWCVLKFSILIFSVFTFLLLYLPWCSETPVSYMLDLIPFSSISSYSFLYIC